MPLISGTIPSLINGVSQQPATLRLPTQGERQENGLSHIARGLEKRPCTEHVTEVAGVTSNDSDDVFIHTIRRSEDEAYALIVKGGSTNGTNGAGADVDAEAKLIDLTGYATGVAGSEVYIRSAETSSNITGSNALLAAVQTYLGNFGPNEVFKPNKLSATTIADFTFLLNKTQVVKQDSTRATLTEDRDYESLVYFKVGDYGADYKLTIKEFNVDSDGVMNNDSVRSTSEFQFRTPDNKVKSQAGKGSSGNNESINNSQAVVVSNIAYNLFWGGTRHKVVKVDLNVGGGNDDPATVNVDGAQTVYNQDGTTTGYTNNAAYTGDMGVVGKGTYTGVTSGLKGFSDQGSGADGEFFTVKNASNDDLKGDESIIHIKNRKYPFTVEVTDGKGDSYMRAVNGHDEVAQFGYLPGSKVPSGFIAKVSGDRSSGQDDYYVKWMDGVWKECAQPVYPGGTADDGDGKHNHATLKINARTALDNTTMPVQLYKNFGTVDGVANQIYFVLNTVDWGVREKGDMNTNPFPSFANYVGTPLYTINDIFFHRNRLGFISDENVILSEVGSYFNFFHTTVLSVLDTAVIDVAVSNNQVAILKSAIPFQESLILFSDLQQFKLTSDQFLTPTSVTVNVATNFETSTDAKPVAAGKTIFFPFQRGAYSGIREYFIDVASETNDANEISAHVPEYIEGVVKKLAVSSNEEVLLISSSTNRKELYVYKYYYNDKEKLQSSWSKWTFDADLIDVAFVGSIAFMLFRRGDGSNDKVYLEKLNLSVDSAIAVEDDKIGIRLDRRVKLTSEDLVADSTPIPKSASDNSVVAAWKANQTLTPVTTTANQGGASGSGRTFSITTDATGYPTVFTTNLGSGYAVGNVIRLTDPSTGAGSTNNTADVTIASPLPYTDVDWDKVTDSTVKVKNALDPQIIITCTVATASNTITALGHRLDDDDTVEFKTSNTLPAGLSLNTTYYVIGSNIDAGTFKVSTSSGGSAVNITSNGTGTHKVQASSRFFGSKVIISGLDTDGSFAPRVGQTFTADGTGGTIYTVVETEDTVGSETTISITPSVSEDNKWKNQKVLTFNEREVEYIVETGEKIKASDVESFLAKGTNLSQQRGNTQPVIYAGIPYDFKYQFSEQFLKNNDNSINSGRLQMRNFEVYYDKTGYFKVTVSPKPHDSLYRDITSSEFTGVIVGSSLLGNKSLGTGVYRVPVYVNSKDVKITVSSDSWYPLALQSADWEAMQVLRNQRI